MFADRPGGSHRRDRHLLVGRFAQSTQTRRAPEIGSYKVSEKLLDFRWISVAALLIALVIGAIANMTWRIRPEHPGAFTQNETQTIVIESRMPY
jgi:hypothetical protein